MDRHRFSEGGEKDSRVSDGERARSLAGSKEQLPVPNRSDRLWNGLDQPNKNEGTLLVYDVVPYVPSISTTPLPPGAPAAKILANAKLEKPPGYALPGDFAIGAEVKPGKELLFSVPLESVTRKWSIRMRIDFSIPGDRGVQPLVFVDFEFWQLPKDVQSLSDELLDGALP